MLDDRLTTDAPRPVHDLPAGGLRLIQPAVGYAATIVSGVTTYRHGIATGALPWHLLRDPQRTVART